MKKYDTEMLVDAYKKYGSQEKAAKEIGCSRGTIARALRETGVASVNNKKSRPRKENTPEKVNVKQKAKEIKSLVEAAQSGDKRATLIALRDKLAETIQNCDSGRDMASNSKRLMEVMAEIEAMPDPDKEKLSKHDRLKKKHEKAR